MSLPARAARRPFVLALLLTGAVVVASCGGGDKKAAPSPTASPTPSAPPTASLDGQVDTGEVVVIKVDNAKSAWPLQRGFAKAPVVYQEVVEGQATRLATVFVGPNSPEVGPVRSARDTDIELFAQYGPIVFGYSGASVHVRPHINASALVAVPQERFPQAYTKRGRRPEANNFFTATKRLLDVAPKDGAPVRDVGLRFGDAAAGGEDVAGTVKVRFNNLSYVTFRYDPDRHGWLLTQNGRPMRLFDGTTVAPQNVIVQFVRVVPGPFHDVLGNNSPDTHTIGTGRAVVFRDGERFNGRWKRPDKSSGTHFLDTTGEDIPLRAAGQNWVLLVPTDGKVTTS